MAQYKLNELKSRGIEDILIACVGRLTGVFNAIEAVYPQTQIQQYIIYQIRSSTQFVSYKDIKILIADLRLVYKVTIEESSNYSTKNKSVFPTDDSLLKMLYLATQDIIKNEQVVKEIGVKSYRSFKYILKEEFKIKRMRV